MKTIQRLSYISIVSVLALAACNKEPAPAADTHASDKKAPAPTMSETKEKAKSAMDTATDMLAAKKADFQKMADGKLAAADKNLQVLKDKAVKATGDAKADLDKMVASLNDKRKAAADALAGWKDTSADAWQTFTAKAGEKLDDLQKALDDAIAKAK